MHAHTHIHTHVRLPHLLAPLPANLPRCTLGNDDNSNSILSGWASWIGIDVGINGTGKGRGGPYNASGCAAARRALLKARVKCRDAGLLGRSFPGEAFSKLDPEGAGRLSRLAFKRGLREMGFALVDESPEGDGSGGGRLVQSSVMNKQVRHSAQRQTE